MNLLLKSLCLWVIIFGSSLSQKASAAQPIVDQKYVQNFASFVKKHKWTKLREIMTPFEAATLIESIVLVGSQKSITSFNVANGTNEIQIHQMLQNEIVKDLLFKSTLDKFRYLNESKGVSPAVSKGAEASMMISYLYFMALSSEGEVLTDQEQRMKVRTLEALGDAFEKSIANVSYAMDAHKGIPKKERRRQAKAMAENYWLSQIVKGRFTLKQAVDLKDQIKSIQVEKGFAKKKAWSTGLTAGLLAFLGISWQFDHSYAIGFDSLSYIMVLSAEATVYSLAVLLEKIPLLGPMLEIPFSVMGSILSSVNYAVAELGKTIPWITEYGIYMSAFLGTSVGAWAGSKGQGDRKAKLTFKRRLHRIATRNLGVCGRLFAKIPKILRK